MSERQDSEKRAIRIGGRYSNRLSCAQKEYAKTGSSGNGLLSQGPAPQVPSALKGLTSWFGMEQGVSPSLKSPEEPVDPMKN